MPSSSRSGALAAALVFVAGSLAAQTAAPSPPPGPAARPALDSADLGAFLDGLVPAALLRYDVAGAVVSVVKDGRLLFAKGYGWADLGNRIPVDAERTLFRVASISKLFTATAVMQLVEEGKLDLDQEVGRYLDFELPRRFPEPITLRHILTHTAGFEEAFKKLPADSGQGVPLRAWIVRMTPPQLYRPGTVTSYSNYGSDLAGYIVERVSGTPFPEYLRTRILEPLGMTSSSIAEPLPAELRSRLSREYPTASDSAGEFEVLQGEPSGNLSATATDMARFAIAHLALGRVGEGRILGEATARLMGATQFRTHPGVPGMGLGFFEEHRNGRRIQGHGGDLARFHSHLSLLMDEGVALFVSINSSGRGGGIHGVREVVRDGFLDRYFPAPALPAAIVANAAEVSRRAVGSYTLSRRGESSLGRIAGLLANVDVVPAGDGIEIPFVTGPNGRPIRWRPVDSTVFRNEDGSWLIGYVPGAAGLPDRIAFLGGHELHRVAWFDSRTFSLRLLVGVLGTFVLSLVLWPVAAWVRRRNRIQWLEDGVPTPLRAATRLGALAAVGFVVAFAMFMIAGLEGTIDLDRRTDLLLGAIRLIGLLAILGTAASALALLLSLIRGRNGWARIKYLALTAAGLGFGWFVVHWHLVSANFRY